MGKRVTIKEVAERADVSHQTVSRYLRHSGDGMRDVIRQRVEAAIAELGYRPSLAARAMRTTRTGRLAVLLPDGSSGNIMAVLQGATDIAGECGYDVDMVRIDSTRHTRRQRVHDLAGSRLFEGLLSLTPLGHEVASEVSSVPLVQYALYDDSMRGIGELADAKMIGVMVERLAEWGHRRLVHVAGAYEHESARRRRDAYLETVGRLHLESFAVLESGWDPQAAQQAILDLPEDCGVTAIVAANDTLAAAAIRGAAERGWRVPGDVSITGFDSSSLTPWLTPALTSVDIDHRQLGIRAMVPLLSTLLPDPPPQPDGPFMSVKWRASTGPSPA